MLVTVFSFTSLSRSPRRTMRIKSALMSTNDWATRSSKLNSRIFPTARRMLSPMSVSNWKGIETDAMRIRFGETKANQLGRIEASTLKPVASSEPISRANKNELIVAARRCLRSFAMK